MKHVPTLAALLALAACRAPQPGEESHSAPAVRRQATAQSASGPVAAASDQAAAALVETYYDLLEQKDFAAAGRLWGRGAEGAAALGSRFADLAAIHAEVGAPPPSEGACGSIYISVPVRVRSRQVGGVTRSEAGTVTLRRVNNVDGATPDQLRWHIESIALTPI